MIADEHRGRSITELLDLVYRSEEIADELTAATGLSRQGALDAIAQLDAERRGESITV